MNHKDRFESQNETKWQPLRTAVVIGAGGGIGQALYNHWRNQQNIDYVIGVSRQENQAPDIENYNASWIQNDYSEESITEICKSFTADKLQITFVCICNGILHNEHIRPDKRIEDIDITAMQELFSINTLLPMVWLKHLLPSLRGKHHCSVAVFSARIGSIGDNRCGGWYGYRATKAALNMMLKTASIEFARRARNVKLIAFHPGTTDTNLSRPFQKNVNYEILQPATVARSLTEIMAAQQADGELSFLDWENKPVEW